MPRTRTLKLPYPSLVVLAGAAGSGKSTLAVRNFQPSEIVSTDDCRALISGDAADQRVSPAAFALAYHRAEELLKDGRLAVFDATSVDARARAPLVAMAGRCGVPAVAIVLEVPVGACAARDARRARRVGRAVIEDQTRRLAADLSRLKKEGFAEVHRVRGAAAVRAVRFLLSRPPVCDRREQTGPFDIIGDIHGCAAELRRLLGRLGYRRTSSRAPFRHPGGRRAVFVGDLVDRGPRVVESARLVMAMVAAGTALCVPGNHDVSLAGCLRDRERSVSPGTAKTLREIEALPPAARRRFVAAFEAFLRGLPPHLFLDGGRLAVAHAGLGEAHLGTTSEEARRFAIFGETTGERDRFGLPVRVKWAAAYGGEALVVYGHTPVQEPEWIRNTVNIDTGCVYGGSLTALRYPEREIRSVAARRAYYRPRRSLPAGVGVRAETRALPRRVIVNDPGSPSPSTPPRSPAGPLPWAVAPPRSPLPSLGRRTVPNRE